MRSITDVSILNGRFEYFPKRRGHRLLCQGQLDIEKSKSTSLIWCKLYTVKNIEKNMSRQQSQGWQIWYLFN